MTEQRPPEQTVPALATVLGGTVDVDVLARTLVPEHEAAASRRAPGPSWPGPGSSPVLALPDPYEDRRELGRGGMGAVHEVFDRDLERLVAVKALLPELGHEAALVESFLHEARITALVDHPHVSAVHRLDRGPDGSLLLVMKLIEGQTLRGRLAELGEPPWPSAVLDELLSAYVKVCDAVAFAHSRGVIHLDLKSDNVMVGAFGQVYVVDWGIARRTGPDHGSAGASPAVAVSTGTPTYMSPEQVLFSEADLGERTDVYLLGGMLYEILTGVPPHAGGSVAEVLGSALRGVVVPPGERAPTRQVPPALAAIAMRALEPQQADRYQSVLDLQRDVLAYQRGEERAPRRVYAAGSVVVREGDPGEEAFVVVSGRCEVTAVVDGEVVVLRELGPGDLFGETAVFSDATRTATVRAIDELVVRVVARDMLTQSLGLDSWTGAFVATLADRFAELDRRLRQRTDPPQT